MVKNRYYSTLRAVVLLSIFLSSIITSTVQAKISEDEENFYSGNNILFYRAVECTVSGSSSTGPTELVGNENAEKIWNYLVGEPLKLTAEQAAGVMGNIRQEAGAKLDPAQGEVGGGGGYGLVQWTGSRRTALEKAAKASNVPVSNLAFQLDYIYQETNARRITSKGASQGYGSKGDNFLATLKKQTTVADATILWHDEYEISADTPQFVRTVRVGFANDFYEKFKGTAGASTASTATTAKRVIYIDPGHGASVPQYIDKASGLAAAESANTPERQDVLDVAKRVKAQLETAGYTAVLSHTGPNDTTTFRERVNGAITAKADLALSIHTTPGDVNEVWPQRVGTYREYGSRKDTFTNAATAATSENYATIFAQARSDAEGHTVTTDPGNKTQYNSFHRAGIASKGNISLVQLWSTDIPWVYNEIGQDTGTGISEARKAAYAKGLIEGVKRSLPATSASSDTCASPAFTGGNLAQTTLAYAWPTYRGKTREATPQWQAAVKTAQKAGKYVGGNAYPGIDCGGFVTHLLINSGFEPSYNYSGLFSKGAGFTGIQTKWLKENWQTLGKADSIDTANLQPGDVAMTEGHTFVYVGTIDKFESKIASASLAERAPMAGKESLTDGSFTWYRKK